MLVSAACGQAFLLIAAVFALVVMAAATAGAAEFVLSPDGDDSASGDRENPWRSIVKVNGKLQPGDTAVFLPGEYAGSLAPENGGTRDAPITFRSAEPWAARLVPEGGQDIIALTNREHIAISGFRVDGQRRAKWGTVTDCRHITISGCKMRRSSKPMLVFGSSQVRLLDNMFSADHLRGDMLHLLNSNELLFEGNSTTRVGHGPLIIHNCFNVAVRANVFRCEWGRNYAFRNSGRMLIERNIVTRARDSGGSADSKAKNLCDDSIFRQNIVFGNLHIPLTSNSYAWKGSRKRPETIGKCSVSFLFPALPMRRSWNGPGCSSRSRRRQ